MTEAAAVRLQIRNDRMAPLTLERVQNITGARLLLGEPRRLRANVRDVCTDSRTLHEAGLFIALKGDRFDGHEFVQQALEKGAAGVIVEAGYRVPPSPDREKGGRNASASAGSVGMAQESP